MSIPTPECDKLAAAANQRDILIEFLGWLETQKIQLGRYGVSVIEYCMTPIADSHDALILAFLGIDYQKLETERRALLDNLQKENP